MKSSINAKKYLTAVAAVFLLLVTGQILTATSIPQQIEELRIKYERLYHQYTESLKDAKDSTAKALASEVAIAKKRYEEARKALTISDTTKDKFSNAADKVSETVKKVFATGGEETAVTASVEKNLPGYDDQKISIDGNNYCGQFAMTSVMNGMGLSMDGNKAYKDSNPAGIFTAPPTIVEYLNMNGVAASQKHNATISDITRKIDSGLPVVLLMDSGDGTPHWVNIYGYSSDASGKVTSVKMRDSYWGTSKGHEMDIEKFTKLWKSPLGTKLPGSIVTYSNLMIDITGTREAAFSPGLLNFNFNTATEDNIAGGINDVVNGFKRLAPMQLAGGLTKCVLGIPGTVIGLTGKAVSKGGNSLMTWGKEKMSEGGVVNTLLGGGAVVAGGVTKAAGWLAGATGNLLSSVASIAGNATKKLGYVFAR
ncbi:MAG: hypothetical protein EOM80_08420 [Erysipelotrichia bacterium]|nr:hypothetical protein [Erysipelotrichia bacterium]